MYFRFETSVDEVLLVYLKKIRNMQMYVRQLHQVIG